MESSTLHTRGSALGTHPQCTPRGCCLSSRTKCLVVTLSDHLPWEGSRGGSRVFAVEGEMKVNTHRLTSTTPTPAMTPSELISAVTFLIIMPAMLIIRLLTLLNLNAVVFYYPSGPSSHESRPLASFDSNSAPVSDLEDQTTDFLPLWLTHILQNHDISQLMPQWKGQEAPVVVSIHLTVDFAQPPTNLSFDQMVTINMTKLKHHNGILQAVPPSNTFMHPHGKTGFRNHENHDPHTEKPFQPAAVADLLIRALGPILFFLVAWRRASHLGSSYRSFLRAVKNSRVTVPFRGHNEYANDQKDPQVPSYGGIISEGMCFNKFSLASELDATYR